MKRIKVTSQVDSANRIDDAEQSFIAVVVADIEKGLNEAIFSSLDRDGGLTICMEGFGHHLLTDKVRTEIVRIYREAHYASVEFDDTIQCETCNHPLVWHFKIKVR